MRRTLTSLGLIAATALLSSFQFPVESSSSAEPNRPQATSPARQQAVPDEGALLEWVVETAVREVEAGALATAAETLQGAISRPWWSEQSRAHLDLALATCLIEVSQQARENEDDELCRSSLARASAVIERSALPLAFESEAAKIRFAVHSLGGDQLLAATAAAQVERLTPDFGQREVNWKVYWKLISTGVTLLAAYLKAQPHVEKAISSWEVGDRREALKQSFLALYEAVPVGKKIKGPASYGATLFERIIASLKQG